MNRHRNGRFKSKRQSQLEQARKKEYLSVVTKTTMTGIVIALILGFALQPWTGTYQNVVQEAHAQEPTDLCGLNVVVCEGEDTELEQKIQKAIQEIPHESPETENRIRYIYEQSAKEGVDGDVMAHIAFCESGFRNIQSKCIYNFTDERIGIYAGEQEKSYGIFMFSTPHHPMTQAQAYDPYFSTDRAISFVKNGQYIWHGYSPENDSCTNTVKEYWK